MPRQLNPAKTGRLNTSPVIFFVLVAMTVLLLNAAATAITRGYQSDDEGIKTGMVVSISSSGTADTPKVERASQDSGSGVIGVTVEPSDNLVTVASGDEHVYVESDGEADAYITDLNGEVKKGDLLGLSPLKGILMKVSSTGPAIAVALEDVSSQAGREYGVEGVDGLRTAHVTLGRVNLDQKAINNLVISRSDSSLERLGRAITGKDVGEIRVAIALLIFLIVMVAEGGIIYGAVSSTITSLGRNPLAKQFIGRELLRVSLIVLAVLAFGVAAIYAVLWA